MGMITFEHTKQTFIKTYKYMYNAISTRAGEKKIALNNIRNNIFFINQDLTTMDRTVTR